MRKSITILSIFLILCTTARATGCGWRFFQEEKINLALCQNHGRGKVIALLMEARTKALNEYIKEKIARGELENKKFEIRIYDPILSVPYLELTQGKNGYFVILAGTSFPSLQQLKAIVDYFAKPDWTPFFAAFEFRVKEGETNEDTNNRRDAVGRRIDNVLNSNADKPLKHEPFAIWGRDGIAVELADDRLRYSINGTVFPLPVAFPLPVKIQDRYLFFQNDSIVVVQDMEIIQTFDIAKAPIDENIRVTAYPKWVNITFSWSGRTDWAYSYSFDKNRLFVNPRWKYGNLTTVDFRNFSYNDFLWRMDNHGGVMIVGYSGTDTEITIPNTINGIPVNGINQSAFRGKNLTCVKIPSSVRVIHSSAFAENQLTDIIIPSSVVFVGSSAFRDNLLINVTIPKGVTHIEHGTFSGNHLTDITILNSVVFIDMSAFENNRLQNVTIPESVREIGSWVFRNNPIISVTIGANVVLSSRILGRDCDFVKAYNEGGKQAGIYTRPNTRSTIWTRK